MSKKSKLITTENVSVENVQVENVQVENVQVENKKKPGIGKFIVEQILTTEKSNTEILNDVLKEFEGSKTTMACIAWYKSKLRKEGKIAPRSVKIEKTEVKAEEVPV